MRLPEGSRTAVFGPRRGSQTPPIGCGTKTRPPMVFEAGETYDLRFLSGWNSRHKSDRHFCAPVPRGTFLAWSPRRGGEEEGRTPGPPRTRAACSAPRRHRGGHPTRDPARGGGDRRAERRGLRHGAPVRAEGSGVHRVADEDRADPRRGRRVAAPGQEPLNSADRSAVLTNADETSTGHRGAPGRCSSAETLAPGREGREAASVARLVVQPHQEHFLNPIRAVHLCAVVVDGVVIPIDSATPG